MKCLEKLSASFRQLVDLYYGKALSILEVARATGRPRGSVEVSLWRARRQLAKLYAQDHGKGRAMNPRQFDALMQRYFAEELTAEEEQSLEKALLSDEAARFRFVELSDQEAAIRIVAQGADLAQQYSRVIGGGQGAPKAGRSLRVPARSKWLAAAGAAAAAAVLLTVGAKFLFRDAWPGSSLENNTGSVIRKSLRDGTQLALEPGGATEASGS